MNAFWKTFVVVMILIGITWLPVTNAEDTQTIPSATQEIAQTYGTDTGKQPPSQPDTPAGSGLEVYAGEMPRLVPWLDYTGDLWHRAGLMGDWADTRQQLMDKGIRFDMSLIQTLQGNWTGGTDFGYPYQGNVRYGIQLDTGKAGLWPGGLFVARGETRYGNSNNLNTGALMPVNTASLFPVPEKDITALTDLCYMQFLAPWVGIMAGKMSMRETNVFASNETEQFMNTAFIFNPALATTVPIDALAGSVILRPTEWLTVPTMVLDSEGTADHSGFDTVFNRGTTVFQQATIEIKPF